MSDSDHLPVGRHPEPQYVYIVEQGAYSNRGVVGVYVTAEDAMADHPIPADYRYPNKPSARNTSHRGGWQPATDAEPGHLWSNGLDWEDGKYITRYELQGALSRVPQGRDTWQPIETAPKDGTRVLLWAGLWWHPMVGCYIPSVTEHEIYLDGFPNGWHTMATHWMPMPPLSAPPASADELGEK